MTDLVKAPGDAKEWAEVRDKEWAEVRDAAAARHLERFGNELDRMGPVGYS